MRRVNSISWMEARVYFVSSSMTRYSTSSGRLFSRRPSSARKSSIVSRELASADRYTAIVTVGAPLRKDRLL